MDVHKTFLGLKSGNFSHTGRDNGCLHRHFVLGDISRYQGVVTDPELHAPARKFSNVPGKGLSSGIFRAVQKEINARAMCHDNDFDRRVGIEVISDVADGAGASSH